MFTIHIHITMHETSNTKSEHGLLVGTYPVPMGTPDRNFQQGSEFLVQGQKMQVFLELLQLLWECLVRSSDWG